MYVADKQQIISMSDALIEDPLGEYSIRLLANGSITLSTYCTDDLIQRRNNKVIFV